MNLNNVSRLIGVGLEQLGVEEFVEGKFFSGELFLDLEKKTYAKLGFQRMSIKEVFSAIFSRKSRQASSKAKVIKERALLGFNLNEIFFI